MKPMIDPSMVGRHWLPLSVLIPLVLAAGGCATGSRAGAASSSRPRQSWFGRKGAPWTIRCLEIQGPNRQEHIAQVAETLRNTPGIRAKDVFTTDDRDGFARLYYGTYFRRTDPKTGRRSIPRKLEKDLKLIKELGTGPGEYYFLRALTVRMPTPNVGNPDWDLAKVDDAYTLQVGVFEPTDEFWEYKQAAAQFCELLREKGYEAYYYHTDSASVVTVGTFGAGAVIPNPRGLPSYSGEVLALQRQDELLRYNRLNGAIYRAQTDQGTMQRVPSRLVRIPQSGAAVPW